VRFLYSFDNYSKSSIELILNTELLKNKILGKTLHKTGEEFIAVK